MPKVRKSSVFLSASFTNISRTLELQLIANTYYEPLECELVPAVDGEEHHWHRLIDTSLPSPHDIVRVDDAPRIDKMVYEVAPYSVLFLVRPYVVA